MSKKASHKETGKKHSVTERLGRQKFVGSKVEAGTPTEVYVLKSHYPERFMLVCEDANGNTVKFRYGYREPNKGQIVFKSDIKVAGRPASEFHTG